MNKKVIAIVVSVIVAIVAISGVVAWFVPIFKVGTIDVTGAARTDPEPPQQHRISRNCHG